MQIIRGSIRTTIYTSETGFFVGTFKVRETDEELSDLKNKVITITGILLEPNEEDMLELKGVYQKHDRYGMQFQLQESKKIVPEEKDAIVDFLASPLIKGCGRKTAEKIVEKLGEKALSLIKENISNLMLVEGMTEKKAKKVYQSLLDYSEIDDMIVSLKALGFTIVEANKIIKRFKKKTMEIVENNIYQLKEYVNFDKLDKIFLSHHEREDMIRLEACLLEAMERMSHTNGDVYYMAHELPDMLKSFGLILDEETFQTLLQNLVCKKQIVIEKERYYLKDFYQMEKEIASMLYQKMSYPEKEMKNLKEKLNELERILDVSYNQRQKDAIITSLTKRVSIISGGPGTGKTTIIQAITKLFIDIYKLSSIDISSTIALLAPTGRAAKKMATSTLLPAMTIHRFLKWNKETNEFSVNEENKNHHKLLIVDETSMIDEYLFYSLLKGTDDTAQLILVGDTFQLPSVGPGLVLNDLVESGVFSFTMLDTIYRQSLNSYIPELAREIKEHQLGDDFLKKKDDYNFIECDSRHIKEMVRKIIQKSFEKGLRIDDIQVLAPMYKGENGIDNLNAMMQSLANPKGKEISYYDVIYRENDKVLQLVNNPDCNVYNGDIGYIETIREVQTPKKQTEITIDFDGNRVVYTKEDLKYIKHAYAITIHKSQGSEFPHVVIPVSKNYYKMLYNKLIYTGVSRAKKSLILIGEKEAFQMAVYNDYSTGRKTSLKERLEYKFHKNLP